MDTMELWNSVCETDPAITKTVNQRGGFTAICAQAQLKTATHKWGPYGAAWGVKDLAYEYVRDSAGDIVEAAMTGVFFAPDIEFSISSDMLYKPGNDSRKKLLTDLTTKSLSKLGFNADVFEGKFDDNKYVAAMQQKFSASAETITDDEAANLALRLDKVGGDGAKFLAKFTEITGVKVETIEDIPASEHATADKLVAAMEAYVAKQAGQKAELPK